MPPRAAPEAPGGLRPPTAPGMARAARGPPAPGAQGAAQQEATPPAAPGEAPGPDEAAAPTDGPPPAVNPGTRVAGALHIHDCCILPNRQLSAAVASWTSFCIFWFCSLPELITLCQDANTESVNHTMRPAQEMALVTLREAVMGACLDILCKCADVRREAITLEVLRRSVNQTSNLPKIGSSLHQARLSVPGLKTWIAQRPALFQVLMLYCTRAALQSCTTMHESCAGLVWQPAGCQITSLDCEQVSACLVSPAAPTFTDAVCTALTACTNWSNRIARTRLLETAKAGVRGACAGALFCLGIVWGSRRPAQRLFDPILDIAKHTGNGIGLYVVTNFAGGTT